jgi:DNA-binding transcriptional regulator YdaS (Cro superfamily)
MTAQIWPGQRNRVRVPTVAKTVKLPGPLNERLRRFSFAKGISQQDVILAAVVGYLEKPSEDVRGLRVKRKRKHTRSKLLTSVLKASGGPSLLAKALGVSPQAVIMWKQVPAAKVLAVEEISGVRREILRPDLYDERGQLRNETTKEKLVRLADGTRSAAELARLCGVSRQRVHQLTRIDGLIIPVKPLQTKGPNSLAAQARAHGLSTGAVYGRLKKGLSFEEALVMPLQRGGPSLDPNSISAQARAHGLAPNAVHQRLRLGWPLERALTTPPRHKASRPTE